MKIISVYLVCITVVFFLLATPTRAQIEGRNLVAKNAGIEKVGDGFGFTEGPAVDRQGNVFFTDQPNNKIIKWSFSTGELSTFSEDAGRANGMYFTREGDLIACADMENQVWSFDKEG